MLGLNLLVVHRQQATGIDQHPPRLHSVGMPLAVGRRHHDLVDGLAAVGRLLVGPQDGVDLFRGLEEQRDELLVGAILQRLDATDEVVGTRRLVLLRQEVGQCSGALRPTDGHAVAALDVERDDGTQIHVLATLGWLGWRVGWAAGWTGDTCGQHQARGRQQRPRRDAGRTQRDGVEVQHGNRCLHDGGHVGTNIAEDLPPPKMMILAVAEPSQHPLLSALSQAVSPVFPLGEPRAYHPAAKVASLNLDRLAPCAHDDVSGGFPLANPRSRC